MNVVKQYALLIALVAGIAICVGCFGVGYKAGHAVAALDAAQEKVTELDRVIRVDRVVIQQVPKIVERVVTKEVTVTKEVDRVITLAGSMLAPDCVMPDNFGLLLVAAANGVDPSAPGVPDEAAGRYDCRETLTAVLSDLRAGWRNTARLEGLQQYEKLLSTKPTNEGGKP
jgi:hypothetical protein